MQDQLRTECDRTRKAKSKATLLEAELETMRTDFDAFVSLTEDAEVKHRATERSLEEALQNLKLQKNAALRLEKMKESRQLVNDIARAKVASAKTVAKELVATASEAGPLPRLTP